jgi:hypothetical protein
MSITISGALFFQEPSLALPISKLACAGLLINSPTFSSNEEEETVTPYMTVLWRYWCDPQANQSPMCLNFIPPRTHSKIIGIWQIPGTCRGQSTATESQQYLETRIITLTL